MGSAEKVSIFQMIFYAFKKEDIVKPMLFNPKGIFMFLFKHILATLGTSNTATLFAKSGNFLVIEFVIRNHALLLYNSNIGLRHIEFVKN